jgi:hypothetical protein
MTTPDQLKELTVAVWSVGKRIVNRLTWIVLLLFILLIRLWLHPK